MQYETQPGDNDITTLRVTKRIRRKLGDLITGNETLEAGLERILDAQYIKI